ncbi:hypothetical protein DPSP01_013752 [Paraphaeosphaeria sporulosa]|uniref:Glutamyl-tRNA synthetase n=1 Tax=Paraphaeosphaeria sporulosa TaxID=1460663 RepID=A0A177CSQ8_9PLEO|nr:uncharacterized protein CC84DRAFT_459387 [Paraphaeosphaeria sporulosa]OAG10008.1 hypothetical protein CC84DRAFT_459387 [Paraphaeosphaeria sporulosa]
MSYETAIAAIDAAHAQDPNKITIAGKEVPYELHYAEKCTSYLDKRSPDASEALRLAIRAQHFRRWEVPRNTYPMTRVGYHTWRTYLKKRQADLVMTILDECYGTSAVNRDEHMAFLNRVGSLIKKEGLKEGDEEAGVLEDVACLVFLDDQFDKYAKLWDEGEKGEGGLDEEKVLGILRKTWAKMTEKGHELALQIPMEGRPKELIQKALAG